MHTIRLDIKMGGEVWKYILLIGLCDDNFEEILHMVDSIFQSMNPDFDKLPDTRKVPYLKLI